MKVMFLTALSAVLATSTLAAKPSAEMVQVTRALVSITEDMTPTHHDGAPIYESSIEIEPGEDK